MLNVLVPLAVVCLTKQAFDWWRTPIKTVFKLMKCAEGYDDWLTTKVVTEKGEVEIPVVFIQHYGWCLARAAKNGHAFYPVTQAVVDDLVALASKEWVIRPS